MRYFHIVLITILGYGWSQRGHIPFSVETTYNVTRDLVESAYEWMTFSTGLTGKCPFVTDILSSLESKLTYHIQCQDQAISAIINAAAAWDFNRRSGSSQPLILAFTGPTGVGKSETAFQLASAVLEKRTRVTGTNKFIPRGLLTIRSEDFSEATLSKSMDATFQKNSIIKMQEDIKVLIMNHLISCEGTAIIVFEEVQKMASGVLEVLMPAFEKRGSIRYNGVEKSTEDCIFIFISDIATDIMIRHLLTQPDRNTMSHASLRNEVKLALDKQWKRLGFGKVINDVIPFLPLQSIHLQQIFQNKIAHMSDKHAYLCWQRLVVDSKVSEFAVGPDFLDYHTYSLLAPAVDSHDNPSSDSQTTFATYGARSLENAGPLEDLKSILYRHMQPWRPTQVLHVGLIDKYNIVSSKGRSSMHSASRSIRPNDIYLQWCSLESIKDSSHETMTPTNGTADCEDKDDSDNHFYDITSQIKDDLIITEVAFSDLCETVWIGPLSAL